MRSKPLVYVLFVLMFASLACQLTSGGGATAEPQPGTGGSNPSETASPAAAPTDAQSAPSSASGFPITSDAYNVTDLGGGNVLYYTHLSLNDVLGFYRAEYVSQGYAERGLLTVVSDTTINLVFDGDPSGKAVVIQCVDLGDGSVTVSIRLEDL